MKKQSNTPNLPEPEVEQEEIIKRTQKEFAQAVAKAVSDINKVKAVIPLIENFWWFKKDMYEKFGQFDVATSICKKHDVPYEFVRKVGQFDDLPDTSGKQSDYNPDLESIG